MAFTAKVYIVQRADNDGNLFGEVVAAKLTFGEAQRIAASKGVAPAKVTMLIADKTTEPNGVGQIGHHDVCKPKALVPKPFRFEDLDAK